MYNMWLPGFDFARLQDQLLGFVRVVGLREERLRLRQSVV